MVLELSVKNMDISPIIVDASCLTLREKRVFLDNNMRLLLATSDMYTTVFPEVDFLISRNPLRNF